ncbi:bifunctional serine/threonine-protein kinase/formylglycine-generating enzyme family protein [Calothrix sp. PCC 7507]|uniref:bifunctional serine/threonine-protein kinase/formylglycine-generating enzyme family protein n=1 Tax=Calothrix sp. PCC 7507 TaxID=99598 RepID=UPI00029EEE55|nr:bifunctional serine/threonine-protein kinase/formylglycine-generating enzyme family protein [Calothrix sp. PCC 7507]AFY31543.1 serine/threonine protein kinase [Calothrix sp. PCC 7507]
MTILAGRYEIIGQLGGRGFAITFLAKDHLQSSNPLCVVKQLRPYHIHPQLVELFEQEITILEKLGKHPQIPQLWAYFSENQHLYIVHEFIPGHDLSQEILPGKRSDERYVTDLLPEILEVLSFVHSQGIIHGDIKPRNLMRRYEDGKIFLLDFGTVKEIASLMVDAEGEFISSAVIGTPGYMPNEQKKGNLYLSSDVYALGITAIQALTGIKPGKLPRDIKTGEVIWQDQVNISTHTAGAIAKMVSPNPSQRYPNAIAALQGFTSPSPQSTDWSRRQAIKAFSCVGAGLAASVLIQKIFPSPTTETTVPLLTTPDSLGKSSGATARAATHERSFLKTAQFEVVTVDKWGKIINRYPREARFFTEELGRDIPLEMVQIPGGKFVMGSSPEEKERHQDEGPKHTVVIKTFYISKFPITQKQYQAVMNENPSRFIGRQRPVEQVSWDDAIAFCRQLSQQTGKNYQLPSEAQWEYACRAGTNTPFHFGETITSALGNYDPNFTYGLAPQGKYLQETTVVGSFPPNAFGLYDMHGLVWEWCQDIYFDSYNGAPTDGSARISDRPHHRLLRGGSWGDKPGDCRSANRIKYPQNFRSLLHGFRVVLSVLKHSE